MTANKLESIKLICTTATLICNVHLGRDEACVLHESIIKCQSLQLQVYSSLWEMYVRTCSWGFKQSRHFARVKSRGMVPSPHHLLASPLTVAKCLEKYSRKDFSWNYLPVVIDPRNYLVDFRAKMMPLLRPNWNPGKIVYQVFDGTTNTLVGLHEEGKQEDTVLLRINGEGTNLFIDRESEILMMLTLYREGLASLVYCQFKNGLCYRFAPGRSLDEQDAKDEVVMRKVTRIVALLHAVEIPAPFRNTKPLIWTRCDEWLEKVPREFSDPRKNECFRRTIGSIEVLQKELERLKLEVASCQSPVVFCHNDLGLNNMIYNEKDNSITLIDLEYGGPNYMAFDIGQHFCQFANIGNPDHSKYPDETYQKKWIKMYLEEKAKLKGEDPAATTTDEGIHTLYREVNKFALGVHLYLCLWALLQTRYSTLDDINFIEYAEYRFMEYQRRKEGFYSL